MKTVNSCSPEYLTAELHLVHPKLLSFLDSRCVPGVIYVPDEYNAFLSIKIYGECIQESTLIEITAYLKKAAPFISYSLSIFQGNLVVRFGNNDEKRTIQ